MRKRTYLPRHSRDDDRLGLLLLGILMGLGVGLTVAAIMAGGWAL